jgi:hypothetical protein
MPEFTCPHCARDLEDPVELSTGLCTSDDCPRHDQPAETAGAPETTEHPAIQAARDLYGSDTIEFDAEPQVSEGAAGTWVQAWVFVPIETLEA